MTFESGNVFLCLRIYLVSGRVYNNAAVLLSVALKGHSSVVKVAVTVQSDSSRRYLTNGGTRR